MEIIVVTSLIVIFDFLVNLNYLAGVWATPKDRFFMGTVHWPGDYFSYLSQFSQGAASWFTSYNLFSSDFKQRTFFLWIDVFLGRLFHLIGISQIPAYQLSVAVFVIILLVLSFL